VAAFLIGLPFAAAVLAAFHYGPLRRTPVFRYVEYPVQWAEVVMFCCGVGALASKLLRARAEADACHFDVLPRWDGKPWPLDRAADLMASLHRLPARLRDTVLGRRVQAVVDFLCQRKSSAQLDDQMRALADNDAITLEGSFGLVRFITWAIPILGFLGTVLGITAAISGVTPEALEGEGITRMTDGLAEAFDATALALGLTMLLMFLSFLVERQEQGVLEAVDGYVERQLAHRFERAGADLGPVAALMERQTQGMVQAVEGLAQKQAEAWAGALAAPEKRAAELHGQMLQQVAGILQQALENTLATHSKRLQALEQQVTEHSARLVQQMAGLAQTLRDTAQSQQQALTSVAQGIAGQTAVLAKLQEGETNLVHLQAVLHQNLAALASASSFEEAVHSLTAAVHLLTARATGQPTPRVQTARAA
jgi:biopolymer transport protein ExbB/TolQ